MFAREIFLASTMLLVTMAAPLVHAKDCTTSKEFQLKHAQRLSGVLLDPNGISLSGIKVQLISEKGAIREARADSQGRYDFGEVPKGKYRIKIRYADGLLCAPKPICGEQGCSFEPRIKLNPKNEVLVR